MASLFSKCKVVLMSAFFALTCAVPAWADDTEIFVGKSLSDQEDPERFPNILFVLDSSGSMSSKVTGAPDGSPSRMQIMQDALHDLLEAKDPEDSSLFNIRNVNIGLMDFNAFGGPILFPISNIDLSAAAATGISGVLDLQVSSSEDDAEESGFIVDTTGGTLDIVTTKATAGSDGGEFCNSPVQSIPDNDSSGISDTINIGPDITLSDLNVSLTIEHTRSHDLVVLLTHEDSGTTITLLDEPHQIIDSSECTGNNVDVIFDDEAGITAELGCVSNSSPLPAAALTGYKSPTNSLNAFNTLNINGDWTLTVIDGDNGDTGDLLEWCLIPNVQTLEQRITSNKDDTHQRASDLALRTTADRVNLRRADGTVRHGGIIFRNISFPLGANIISAELELTGDQNTAGSGDFEIELGGENHDYSTGEVPLYSNNVFGSDDDVFDRLGNRTVSRVTWGRGPGTPNNLTNWFNNGVFISPDITSIIDEIVNGPGATWTTGSESLSFLLEVVGTCSDNCQRRFESRNNKPSEAALLRIRFQDPSLVASAPPTPGVVQTVGIRFQVLDIPQGSTITNARLEFVADGDSGTATSIVIQAEDSDDAADFITNPTVTGRPVTSNSITWTPPAFVDGSTNQTSPGLDAVVQEVVNRTGWCAGNDMAFILTGTGARQVHAFDGDIAQSPKLHIEFTPSTTGCGATATTGPNVRAEVLRLIGESDGDPQGLVPSGGTPAVGALAEASRYYRGENVFHGLSRFGLSRKRVSHPFSYEPANTVLPANCDGITSSACSNETIQNLPPVYYKSPIGHKCQKNFVVLLTDGVPNTNSGSNETYIESLSSGSCTGSFGSGQRCGRLIANFLANNDQSVNLANTPGSQNIENDNVVITHTIGFSTGGASQEFLEHVAAEGGGLFKPANSAGELADAFSSLIGSIISENSTLEAPSISSNSFNRLTSRDDLFFALFRPEGLVKWPGNVKKYKLKDDVIVDVQNNVSFPAINAADGTFSETACSFWSDCTTPDPGPDGADTAAGGMAGQFGFGSGRDKIYTYTSSGDPVNVNITLSAHRLSLANSEFNSGQLTKALFGLDAAITEVQFHNRIMDARSEVDTDADGDADESNHEMGDPLHSKPTVITYDGTPGSEDLLLAVTTNRGFFHLVDVDDGSEIFSFIPQALLPNLERFFLNSALANAHPYGLDNTVVVFRHDEDPTDGPINATNGDHVYVYLTMRRGGRNIYALDITDRNNPKLKWRIEGGISGDDFEELGQTWSRPVLAKVDISGTETDVLFFGGGYDPAQDALTDPDPTSGDTQGRAVFAVNADTGAFIGSVGPTVSHTIVIPEMKYSIPADLKVIDTNADGLADRIYLVDTGGQILRIDIGGAGQPPTSGGVIIQLQNTSGAAPTLEVDNRRFYQPVDVTLLDNCTIFTEPVLALAVGSGYRAHPLNEAIEERFYVVFDPFVGVGPPSIPNPPSSPTILTYDTAYGLNQGDLVNLSGLFDNTTGAAQAALDAAAAPVKGWYIDLAEGPGEKVLSESLTFASTLLFTSYTPPDSTAISNECVADLGTGRLYVLDACNSTTQLVSNDKNILLLRNGLPPEPSVLFVSSGTETPTGEADEETFSIDPTFVVGTEVVDIPELDGKLVYREWWRQGEN